MISYGLLLIAICLYAEAIYRSSLAIRASSIVDTLKKSKLLLRSVSISDHWKEKVLMVYSQQLLVESLMIAGIVFIITFIFYCAVEILAMLALVDSGFLYTNKGIVLATLVGSLYVAIRVMMGRRP